MLEVIYELVPGALRAFVGQQMDVFVEAEASGVEAPVAAGSVVDG